MNYTCAEIGLNISLVEPALRKFQANVEQHLIYFKIIGFISLISIVVNVLFCSVTIISLLKDKVGFGWKRFSYLVNLSIADIIYAGVNLLIGIVSFSNDIAELRSMETLAAVLANLLFQVSFIVTCSSLAAVCSIQRLAISQPITYQQMTRRKVIVSIVVGWMVSIVAGSTSILLFYTECELACTYVVLVISISTKSIIIISCLVGYCYIILALRRRYRSHPNQQLPNLVDSHRLGTKEENQEMLDHARSRKHRHYRVVKRLACSTTFVAVVGILVIAFEVYVMQNAPQMKQVIQLAVSQMSSDCDMTLLDILIVLMGNAMITMNVMTVALSSIWLSRSIAMPVTLMIGERKCFWWFLPNRS